MDFLIEDPALGLSAVCVPILRTLPDWFGIEAAIRNYQQEIDGLATLLAKCGPEVIGFLSIKVHNVHSAEVYVMGVRPGMHRQGVGRGLVCRAEEFARDQGIEYLQVKTLGPSRHDQGYARTRAFYSALGFRPLEEFQNIWDERNPCLVFVKRI
ncbi:MAG: GNAT family N-acetyltransferase [Chloroflexota bacterium]